MTDDQRPLGAIERAAELVPLLTERLERHGLAEIEVRQGDFSLRAAGMKVPATGAPAAREAAAGDSAAAMAGSEAPDRSAAPAETSDPGEDRSEVRSPAVGFFLYADGLGPGLDVARGDSIGHVEMLGVRHEVRAQETGIVRHLVAESGEAVEYGQVLVEVEAAAGRGR